MNYDWSELAFASKKPLHDLNATFIIAPRELSPARFKQLVKEYLPKGNLLLGLAKETHVAGFEGQPQFRTLDLKSVQPIIDQVNKSDAKFKIYTLAYFQRELPFLLEKLKFQKVVGINGSWRLSFHLRPEFYTLTSRKIDYELVSPFASEDEARACASKLDKQLAANLPAKNTVGSAQEMLALAGKVARNSFDYTFQIGAVLAKRSGGKYKLLAASPSKVVPFSTSAMHFGSARERHFSAPGDLNFYDTVHAETEIIIAAGRQKIDLAGTSLFINVLPCPTCGRNLAETDIAEIIYSEDHSDGYSLKLLELAGKKVSRMVL